LGAPTIDLTLEEACGFAELPETDRLEIDGVESREDVDEFVGGGKSLSGVEMSDIIGIGVDDALDEVHEVEGHAQHRVVLAERHGSRDGNIGALKAGLDSEFPSHVVGGGQERTHRRATEHPIVRVVLYSEREIR